MRGFTRWAAAAASFSILISASPGAARFVPGKEFAGDFRCGADQRRRGDGPLRGAAGTFALDPRMVPLGSNAAVGSEAAMMRVACGGSVAGAEPATGPLHQAGALFRAAGPATAPAVVCRGLIQFGSNDPKELHAWVTIRPDALDLRFASAGDSWRQSYRYTRDASGDYSVQLPAGWMSYSRANGSCVRA